MPEKIEHVNRLTLGLIAASYGLPRTQSDM